MKVAIIGGGAAGFFAAIQVKENYPNAQVVIFEKSSKVLSKVKVSGGGRCNVTNGCVHTKELLQGYPRGNKVLKQGFRQFNNQDTMQWFQQRGVKLKTEKDGRVFPVTNKSQTIIDCFFREVQKHRIDIQLQKGVRQLQPKGERIELTFEEGTAVYDKVIVTTGGSPKKQGFDWLAQLGHEIKEPVPSLFTFNLADKSITQLMGVVADPVTVTIQGTKLKSKGPLLITHWGMSGPAVLKLSAFAARDLFEKKYDFSIQVNWVNTLNDNLVREFLQDFIAENGTKSVSKIKPYAFPERLWLFLLERIDILPTKKWSELGKKGLNKLINLLTNDVYAVKGKTTFKEEFVTCGGVSLSSIRPETMESKTVKNLYFAGEVLDIDGITGGYNFQAAWTTAFLAGK